jgi:hypothetical protein
MLVRFDSDVGGFTMFGEAAVKLLKMMGHSGTVPSAILADDIPAALDRLRAAVAADSGSPSPSPTQHTGDAEAEPKVSLKQQAYPLIDLLTRAAKRGSDVMWKSD